MRYVDAYVIPIPKRHLKAYVKMAQLGKRTWMKHGALDYYECVADDLTSWGLGYAKMAKLKKGETVVVAFVVYKSRAHRDRVNAKVMKEFAEADVQMDMPFDVKRMANGGFTVIVGS